MSFPGNRRSSFGHPADPSPRSVADMDQLYEQWLLSQRPGWGEESSSNSVRENGKQIHMPTDYAEEVVSGIPAPFEGGSREGEKADAALAFIGRLEITAGCAAKTATARSSGSSTSPRRNTRTASSTPRTTTTAGSIDFPRAPSGFARGESGRWGAERR